MFSPRRNLLTQLTACAAIATAASALLLLNGCASAPAVSPVVELPFPSPTSGPGHPELDRGAQRHLEDGWQSLLRGDSTGARSAASQSGSNSAATLLELQSTVIGNNRGTIQGLEELTASQPDYAAAWLTLSAAAEKADNEALALSAADRGAELWSKQRWVDRANNLHTLWVDNRIEEAGRLFDSDQPVEAIAALAPAMALEPGNRDAVLLKTRALVAVGQPDRAEAALSVLPQDRDVTLLAGNIAEARGDTDAAIRIYSSLQDDPEATLLAVSIAESEHNWQTAMDLYTSLPENHPEKAEGLGRAKLRWRISVMPTYVQDALTSQELERAQLAVLLLTLVPRVESLPGGEVPLLSDIVDMPSQREIITATRLGLLEVDQFDHRFYPNRLVTVDEARSAVSTLGSLLASEPPQWCRDETEDSCTQLATPISGEAVAVIVLNMVVKESS